MNMVDKDVITGLLLSGVLSLGLLMVAYAEPTEGATIDQEKISAVFDTSLPTGEESKPVTENLSNIEPEDLKLHPETGPVTIPIMFKHPFTSSQLKSGDAVIVAVAQDTYDGETLLFKKGTEGFVFIDKARRGKIMGLAAKSG
jgi:hypothetical protein